METLERHHEIVELYERYYPLLTIKQQNVLEYYYIDNYSLSEISELNHISRNAVHDLIKRTVSKLYDYERKLKLNQKRNARLKLIDALQNASTDAEIKQLLDELEKVETDGI